MSNTIMFTQNHGVKYDKIVKQQSLAILNKATTGLDKVKREKINKVADQIQYRLNNRTFDTDSLEKFTLELLNGCGLNSKTTEEVLIGLIVLGKHDTKSETKYNWFGVVNRTNSMKKFIDRDFDGIEQRFQLDLTSMYEIIDSANQGLIQSTIAKYLTIYSDTCQEDLGTPEYHAKAAQSYGEVIQLEYVEQDFCNKLKKLRNSEMSNSSRTLKEEFGKLKNRCTQLQIDKINTILDSLKGQCLKLGSADSDTFFNVFHDLSVIWKFIPESDVLYTKFKDVLNELYQHSNNKKIKYAKTALNDEKTHCIYQVIEQLSDGKKSLFVRSTTTAWLHQKTLQDSTKGDLSLYGNHSERKNSRQTGGGSKPRTQKTSPQRPSSNVLRTPINRTTPETQPKVVSGKTNQESSKSSPVNTNNIVETVTKGDRTLQIHSMVQGKDNIQKLVKQVINQQKPNDGKMALIPYTIGLEIKGLMAPSKSVLLVICGGKVSLVDAGSSADTTRVVNIQNRHALSWYNSENTIKFDRSKQYTEEMIATIKQEFSPNFDMAQLKTKLENKYRNR